MDPGAGITQQRESTRYWKGSWLVGLMVLWSGSVREYHTQRKRCWFNPNRYLLTQISCTVKLVSNEAVRVSMSRCIKINIVYFSFTRLPEYL